MRFVLIHMLLFFTIICKAQTNKILFVDSLKKELPKYVFSDSNYIKKLTQVGRLYTDIKIDSALYYLRLAVAIKKVENKKLYLIAYNFLGIACYMKGDFDKALENFQKALEFATTCSEKSELKRNKGNILLETKQLNKAIENYKESLEISSACNDKVGIAAALNNLGFTERQQGNFDKAINYILESIRLFEQEKHTDGIGNAYIQIALIEYRRKRFSESKIYTIKAREIFTKLDKPSNISITSTLLGGIETESKNYSLALNYFFENVKYYEKQGDIRQLASTHADIAETYLALEQFDESLYYSSKAIELYKQTQSIQNYAGVLTTKAKSLIAKKEVLEAIKLLDTAATIANNRNSRLELAKVYESYVYAFSISNLSKALYYQKLLGVLKDSIYNDQSSKAIETLKIQYETEKKDNNIKILKADNDFQLVSLKNKAIEIESKDLLLKNQSLLIEKSEIEIEQKNLLANNQRLLINAKNYKILLYTSASKEKEKSIQLLQQKRSIDIIKLKQQKFLLSALFIVVVLISIATYFIIKKRKLQEKVTLQAAINKEQELAAKNILAAEEAERSRLAAELHDGVGQIISAALLNLQQANNQTVQIENTAVLLKSGYDELRNISHQMIPNSLLKLGLSSALKELINRINSNKLKVVLETEGLTIPLDKNVELVLYRVIQEAINNVIKHAQANTLFIQLVNDEKNISITIEDNGVGFNKTAVEQGLGLQNMQHRIQFLKGNLFIETAPNKGTVLMVEVPV